MGAAGDAPKLAGMLRLARMDEGEVIVAWLLAIDVAIEPNLDADDAIGAVRVEHGELLVLAAALGHGRCSRQYQVPSLPLRSETPTPNDPHAPQWQ
jgi:hypothetical protein